MGNNSRSRINFFRKRQNYRGIITKKRIVQISFVLIFILLVTFSLYKIILQGNKNYKNDSDFLNSGPQVSIYQNDVENTNVANKNIPDIKDLNIIENQNFENETSQNAISKIDENNTSDGTMKLTLLGELMMGGEVTKNVNYIYSSAFKDIYDLTNKADFTYATLGTNITNLNTIDDNTKSKYIVTKDIINGINALGIDAVSIATDHVNDFSTSMVNTTIDILNKNNTFVAGLDSSPVYFEKNSTKIAVVAATNVLIGTKNNYEENKINVYNLEKMKNDIKTAKDNAEFVIVDVHWGKEYLYGVTPQMKSIAQAIIDAGADMVIGSHAIGNYPIVKYKDKPIIYSTGYLITDSNINLAKQGYIYNIDLTKEFKVNSIEMIPIYIQDKSKVRLYTDYNNQEANEFLNQMNKWNKENGLNSKIENNKIKVQL